MSCGNCGSGGFSSGASLQCHVSMNHASFPCGCGKSYMTSENLTEHKEDQKMSRKPLECNTNDCCKSFSSEQDMQQHKRAKDHSPTINQDTQCNCGKQFKSAGGRNDHAKAKGNAHNFKPCLTCCKTFETKQQLDQHKTDSNHTYSVAEEKQLRSYLNEYYKNSAAVTKEDQKQSVKTMRETVDAIMNHVRKQDGGDIYGNEIKNAGSYAMKTKVGKADEFDLNIPLNMKKENMTTKTNGKMNYKVNIPTDKGAKSSNLNLKSTIKPGGQSEIKRGQATVNTTDVKFKNVTYKGDIVPRKVKEDLHGKVKEAVKALGMAGYVDISRDAHGPAVTINIKKSNDHHISVDLAATIDKCNIPVSVNQFPRPKTEKTLSRKTIDGAMDAGTHLVPKGDDTWFISNSKAEKALLKTIDEGNECRRMVHKTMKRDFMDWKSKSTHGFPGISSHVLKNATLWMNEKKEHVPGYWKQGNFDQCYKDGLKHLASSCSQGKLPNYFNTSENVLAGKDKAVLTDLAARARHRHDQLSHITQ